MKSLFLSLGSQIFREVLASQGGAAGSVLSSLLGASAPAPAARPAVHPDFAYLTRFAKRLFAITAIGFVCTLFFVMGTMMATGAVAQSIDLFGVFVGSTVFYTGFAIALVAGISALVCVSKARRHSFSWDFFFRHTDAPVTIEQPEIRTRASYAASDSAPVASASRAPAETVTAPATFGTPSYAQAPEDNGPRRPGPERIAS